MLVLAGNMLQGAIPPTQRQALIDLYNATNGDGWTQKTGWKTPPLDPTDGFAIPGTEGSWRGVSVAGDTVTDIDPVVEQPGGDAAGFDRDPDRALQSLNLRSNQMSGTLPDSLGNLTNLIVLHLYENAFTGILPTTFGNLTHLTQLNVHYNQLRRFCPGDPGADDEPPAAQSLQQRVHGRSSVGAGEPHGPADSSMPMPTS